MTAVERLRRGLEGASKYFTNERFLITITLADAREVLAERDRLLYECARWKEKFSGADTLLGKVKKDRDDAEQHVTRLE